MTNEIVTKKLRNGREVLAQSHKKYGVIPLTFTNDTQANTRAVLLLAMGIKSEVIKCGHVQYLSILKEEPVILVS